MAESTENLLSDTYYLNMVPVNPPETYYVLINGRMEDLSKMNPNYDGTIYETIVEKDECEYNEYIAAGGPVTKDCDNNEQQKNTSPLIISKLTFRVSILILLVFIIVG